MRLSDKPTGAFCLYINKIPNCQIKIYFVLYLYYKNTIYLHTFFDVFVQSLFFGLTFTKKCDTMLFQRGKKDIYQRLRMRLVIVCGFHGSFIYIQTPSGGLIESTKYIIPYIAIEVKPKSVILAGFFDFF